MENSANIGSNEPQPFPNKTPLNPPTQSNISDPSLPSKENYQPPNNGTPYNQKPEVNLFDNKPHLSSVSPSLLTGKQDSYIITHTTFGDQKENRPLDMQRLNDIEQVQAFHFDEGSQMEPTSMTEYRDREYPSKTEYDAYDWERPRVIFGSENFELFGPIRPEDIDQENWLDCYFLAALSSLARVPERIKDIFITDKKSGIGRYVVRFFDMGELKEIVIDDTIPCHKDKTKPTPAFAKPVGKVLWVLLLEKVWAKMYGSYKKIVNGLAVEAFRELTGAPTRIINTDEKSNLKKNELWEAIMEGEREKFPMCCSTSVKNDQNGIERNHAYSILGATVKEKDGKSVHLLKLRNPWARGEWQGAWGDDSGKRFWTEELKKKLFFENEDDGIFFMGFEDFLDHFANVHFCYIKDKNDYSSIRVKSKDGEVKVMKLRVERPGEYYISCHQKSKRHYKEDSNYEYSEGHLKLLEKENDKKYSIKNQQEIKKRETWIKNTLEANSEYLITVEIDWDNKSTGEFVVSSYGPAAVEIALIDERVKVKEQGDHLIVSE